MTLKPHTCPYCGDDRLIGLVSQNVRLCPTCKKDIPWELKPGQAPLFEGTAPDPDLCVTPVREEQDDD